MRVKCFAQEHNTMTRPGLEAGPLDPEFSAVTTRPPRLLQLNKRQSHFPSYVYNQINLFFFLPQNIISTLFPSGTYLALSCVDSKETSNPRQDKLQRKTTTGRQGTGISQPQGACGTSADETQNRPSVQGTKRNGMESKVKERKGKERKGKERKGKEREEKKGVVK